MKKTLTSIAIAVMFLTACNNAPKTDEKTVEVKAAPAETKPAFQPFDSRAVILTVKDFDKWNSSMQGKDSMLKANGIESSLIGRDLNDDKKVIIFSRISDVAKAKAFDGSATRKEAMKNSGAVSSTTPSYWKVIMDDTTHIEQMERVMVAHKVKDYDTWKKAFDAEGTATRKANGFYERAISRGIDDPNMVGLVFAVTDMDKTKARMASPELKKIMTDAGVEGTPEVTWFKWVSKM